MKMNLELIKQDSYYYILLDKFKYIFFFYIFYVITDILSYYFYIYPLAQSYALYLLPVILFYHICFYDFWDFFLLSLFLRFNHLADFHPPGHVATPTPSFFSLFFLCLLSLLSLKILTMALASFCLLLNLPALFSWSIFAS